MNKKTYFYEDSLKIDFPLVVIIILAVLLLFSILYDYQLKVGLDKMQKDLNDIQSHNDLLQQQIPYINWGDRHIYSSDVVEYNCTNITIKGDYYYCPIDNFTIVNKTK